MGIIDLLEICTPLMLALLYITGEKNIKKIYTSHFSIAKKQDRLTDVSKV